MSDDPWERRADFFVEHPLLATFVAGLGVIAVVVGLVIVISLISTGAVFFNAGRAKATNGARVQQRIYQPDNTLTQVAFFHNTCNDVRAQYRQWQNAEAQLEQDRISAQNPRLDYIQQQQAVQSLQQDATALTGVADQLANTAEDYNSRSRQYTANAFKDVGLPDQINIPPASGLGSWSPPTCGG